MNSEFQAEARIGEIEQDPVLTHGSSFFVAA